MRGGPQGHGVHFWPQSSPSPSHTSVQAQSDGTNSFLLFDNESEGEEEEELMEEDEEEEDSEISGFAECLIVGGATPEVPDQQALSYPFSPIPTPRYSVENSFFDEKEDTCIALGEISVNSRWAAALPWHWTPPSPPLPQTPSHGCVLCRSQCGLLALHGEGL